MSTPPYDPNQQQNPWQGQPQGQPQYPPPGQYPPPPGQYPPPPGYAQYGAPVRPPASGAVSGIGWAIVGASVLVIIAAFLVWGTVKGGGLEFKIHGLGSNKDVPGGDQVKDGAVTLTLAVVALILGIIRGVNKAALGAAIVALVMGAIVSIVALADIGDISDLKDQLDSGGVEVSIGVGLWLTLIGGIVLVVLGIVGIVKRR